MIKPLNEFEKLECAWGLLQNAHRLLGIQCQNCRYYKPYPDMEGYKGQCTYCGDDRVTYWSQYCDDFDGWHEGDDDVSEIH